MKQNVSNQPLILPDFLNTFYQDNPLRANLFLIAFFSKCLKINKIKNEDDKYRYDIKVDPALVDNEMLNQLNADIIDNMMFEYTRLIKSDDTFRATCITFNSYLKNKESKNYIITKSLSDEFKKSKMTLKGKSLPIGMNCYIEFRDKNLEYANEKIIGSFIHVTEINGDKVIYCCPQAHSGYQLYFTIGCKEEENIVDKFNEKVRHQVVGEKQIKLKENENAFTEFMKLIISSVIFIANKCEDFVIERNQFSDKKSKYETQIKQYTKHDYIVVGKNFHIPKVYHISEAPVVGHFKWRWVGINKSELKYLWWNPHNRNYDKGNLNE